MWYERLAAVRQQKGGSQGQLAEKVGVSLRSIQRWEMGQQYPRLDEVTKLADALGISLDELRTHDKPKVVVKVETLADRIKRKRAEAMAQRILDDSL